MSRLTFGTILILACAPVVLWGILPQWNLVRPKRDEIQALETLRKELESVDQKQADLLEKYHSIPQADLDRLSQVIPTGRGAPNFLINMDLIAVKNGVRLRGIELSSQETGTKDRIQLNPRKTLSIGVNLTISGSYQALRSYLHDIETMVRVTDITNLSFSSNDKPGSTGVGNDYSVHGLIYYVP